jgi:hypothetical protein
VDVATREIDFRVPTVLTGSPAREYPDGDARVKEEARKYAQYVRGLWDEQTELLRPLHEIWVQNLLFLANRQWLQNRNGVFMPDIVPEWREQPVTNLTLPYFKTFLAKATKNRPAWTVRPASADPMDVQAAGLADDVLEAKWTELRLGRVVRRGVGWTIATGNGYLMPFWNNSTGRMRRMEVEMEVPVYEKVAGQKTEVGVEVVTVPLDEDGEPKLGSDGRPVPGAEPYVVDIGDVGVRTYSPFQVRVNAEATDDDEVTHYIIADVSTLREMQQTPAWAKAFEGDSPPRQEDVGVMEDYTRAFVGVMGGDQLSASPHDIRARDLPKALVLHYYEKPCPEYPDGRYWVCTKDTLLEEPGPLPDGIWPPVVHLQDVEMPGRYHAASTLESVVNLNREYNEINGHIKEHHNLFVRGKWLVPKGSGIRKGSITTQPGEVITHNPGFPPTQMDLKPLPGAVYGERERVLNDYELVGGIHRVSQGAPPPGVTAGVAFLQLQEADDTDMGPFLSMLEESIAALASAILQIIKERYNDERLVMVSGKGKKFQVRAFRGADLAGAVDVVPIAESSFPWSKTARQSMLISLAQQLPGVFADETGQFDKAKFARMLPIGGLDVFADQEDIDVQEALNEEDIFSAYGVDDNSVPQVEWWQNHEVHYNTHIRQLKSGAYLQWSKEAQDQFLAHVRLTMQMRDQKRAEANIANGGTPPGGQAPPGPMAPPDQMMEMEDPGITDALPGAEVPGLEEQPAAGEQREMMDALAALGGG